MIENSSLIVVVAIYNFAFAIFHLGFWKLFKWEKDLKHLFFANRAIIQIFNVLGIFYFICMGIICLSFGQDLLSTELGHAVLLMNSVFWLIRFILQFVYLRRNHWTLHLLSFVFFCGFILFLIPIL
jgi:hypothetical protein